MPVFPSREWVEAWVRLAHGSATYQQAAQGWDGSTCLGVRGESGSGGRGELTYIQLDGHDGQWTTVLVGPCRVTTDRELIYMEAPRPVWLEVIRQELPPLKGILQGRILVQGSLSAMIRWRHAITVLTSLAAQIETDLAPASSTF